MFRSLPLFSCASTRNTQSMYSSSRNSCRCTGSAMQPARIKAGICSSIRASVGFKLFSQERRLSVRCHNRDACQCVVTTETPVSALSQRRSGIATGTVSTSVR